MEVQAARTDAVLQQIKAVLATVHSTTTSSLKVRELRAALEAYRAAARAPLTAPLVVVAAAPKTYPTEGRPSVAAAPPSAPAAAVPVAAALFEPPASPPPRPAAPPSAEPPSPLDNSQAQDTTGGFSEDGLPGFDAPAEAVFGRSLQAGGAAAPPLFSPPGPSPSDADRGLSPGSPGLSPGGYLPSGAGGADGAFRYGGASAYLSGGLGLGGTLGARSGTLTSRAGGPGVTFAAPMAPPSADPSVSTSAEDALEILRATGFTASSGSSFGPPQRGPLAARGPPPPVMLAPKGKGVPAKYSGWSGGGGAIGADELDE
jgi:hypothetical protein